MHTIDLHWLGHDKAIATYALPTEDDGVVLIDPGPHSTVEALRAGLDSHGITQADVRHIVITHIHLDHAGAAWWWALHGGTPQNRPLVHVHSFGAKHLIDPSKLAASAKRIYGEQMKPMWGELKPTDQSQVRPVSDGDVLRFGTVELEAIETPGHARHHHAYAMQTASGAAICFSGDLAAMTVPGRPAFVSLPTPPPEFDLGQWQESIGRVRDRGFDALYPTHFGRVDEPAAWLDRVSAALNAHVAFIKDRRAEGHPSELIREAYRAWLTQQAATAGLTDRETARHVTDSLVGMNCAGIERYLDQQ